MMTGNKMYFLFLCKTSTTYNQSKIKQNDQMEKEQPTNEYYPLQLKFTPLSALFSANHQTVDPLMLEIKLNKKCKRSDFNKFRTIIKKKINCHPLTQNSCKYGIDIYGYKQYNLPINKGNFETFINDLENNPTLGLLNIVERSQDRATLIYQKDNRDMSEDQAVPSLTCPQQKYQNKNKILDKQQYRRPVVNYADILSGIGLETKEDGQEVYPVEACKMDPDSEPQIVNCFYAERDWTNQTLLNPLRQREIIVLEGMEIIKKTNRNG